MGESFSFKKALMMNIFLTGLNILKEINICLLSTSDLGSFHWFLVLVTVLVNIFIPGAFKNLTLNVNKKSVKNAST